MLQEYPASEAPAVTRAKSVPRQPYACFWVAALGLALEGAAGEFRKFAPSVDIAQSLFDVVLARILVITLVVAVFLVARRRHEGFVFADRIWAVAVCLGFSMGLALYFSGFLFVASGSAVVLIGFFLTSIAGSAYLLIWFDRIFAFGIRNTLLTVAASLVLRGLIQMFLVLMQETPGVVLITAMPLASLPCFLTVFAQTEELQPDTHNADNLAYSVASPAKIRFAKLAMAMLLAMLFLLPLLTTVTNEQTAQISAALGIPWYRQGSCIGVNLLVGALLFLYARRRFNKTVLLIYFLMVIGLTATAIFTVQTGSPASLLVGSLALQAAKKMLDFGTVFPAFIFSAEGQKDYSRHVAGRLASFVGGLVAAILLRLPHFTDSALHGVFNGSMLFTLFASFIIFFYCLETQLPAPAPAAPEPEEPVPPRQPFKEAIAKLAVDWHLTPTEETILALVARGANADSVSKELVVSVNTAKTHIRNIYSKLDVHSQQELIALVNSTKDEIKNSFEE